MRSRTAWFLLVFFSSPSLVAEEADAGAAVVDALGRLNGVALQCQHFGEAKRIKQAMIAWAPKTIGNGTAFETATNDGFLAVAGGETPCPAAGPMALQVDEAIAALRRQSP
jgi:hypothetical protein